MPYAKLPARLRQMIPAAHGQELFRSVFNSQMQSGKSESVAFASAWGALQSAGYKKQVGGKWLKKSSSTAISNKVDEYNEKYGAKHGRVTAAMLKDVYDRGVGAYRTNPSSVRPNVSSPEQWAMARVSSFLEAARGSKSINHDKDIHDKIKKSSPTASSVHVPSTELDKKDTYRAPAAARAAAQRALRWKEKYGDEVKGGTQVGWTRANQLASNENLSRETVARMAQFARHRKNSSVDPKFKDTPWRDRGHVAWLIWGGTAGVDWAKNIMDGLRKRQVDDDTFTMPDEARARSMMLGLGGEIHVSGDEGQQAFYMPGKTHDDYINALNQIANIESEDEDDDEEEDPVNGGLIDRAIYAIIGAVMQHTDVNKSFEETKVLKVDDEQRIVYGWASVVTEDGAPVVDSQGDVIEPIEMEKMANDFMLDVRTAKAMHAGDKIGEVIHSLPLTEALTKALGLQSDMEGWIVGVKIYSDEVWDSVKSGEFAGFSIGGKAASREEMS